MKPHIAIRNLNRSTLANSRPFYNYVLGLLRSGAITHLFFENISLGEDWLSIRRQYGWEDLNLDSIKCIFDAEELNRECDILLSLDSQPEDFSPAVQSFPGLKIYHLMDYFWGEPLSEKIARLEKYGVDYLMSYGSPDRHDPYFKKYGTPYMGRVIPVPFGFNTRFFNTTSFENRLARCVALGSVRPLSFPDESPKKYKEMADFFAPQRWFHPFRRMLVERADELSDFMDSLLPIFPRYRDYDYDLPAILNKYRTFVSDESVYNFASAKAFEGPACGSVMICADHPCFTDLGFKDGVNCIMHKPLSVDDFRDKASAALKDQESLRRISIAGEEFVRTRYSEEMVGTKLGRILHHLHQHAAKKENIPNLPDYCYRLYQEALPATLTQPLRRRSLLYRWVYIYGGIVYLAGAFVWKLPRRVLASAIRAFKRIKIILWQNVRTFRNRRPWRDRKLRASFMRSYRKPTLPAPTPEETQLIQTLRAELGPRSMIDPATKNPARKWMLFVEELRHNIASKDPRSFLSWPVVDYNMVYDAASSELHTIENLSDWPRWRAAMTEPLTTRQQPFYLAPDINENTVRQAYHLAILRNVAKKDVLDFDTIVEFGGGYGSMYRLVRNLGFTGRYIIFDWKEFSALQRFYAGLTGTPPPNTVNTIEQLQQLLAQPHGKTLLIATWSLSESPIALRDSITETVRPDTALIAYQKEFAGVDNEAYFTALAMRYTQLHWHKQHMDYLPTENNVYLIGTTNV